MEILIACVVATGLVTALVAFEENINWTKSYEDAAKEQREEDKRRSRRNSIAKS